MPARNFIRSDIIRNAHLKEAHLKRQATPSDFLKLFVTENFKYTKYICKKTKKPILYYIQN